MDMTQIIKVLIDDTGLSIRKFAEKCNLPHTTIHTVLKNGCEKASINTVISICDELHVNIEDIRNLSKRDNVTTEDILSLKDKYIERDNFMIQNEIKENADLLQLMKSLKNLDPSLIKSLSEAFDNASPEDISLLTNIIKKVTNNSNDK